MVVFARDFAVEATVKETVASRRFCSIIRTRGAEDTSTVPYRLCPQR